jgi:prepilin peptidase CpaA
MPRPIIATLLIFVVLCWATDVRARRIPNVASGAALLVGAGLNWLYFGLAGLGASLLGLLAAAGVLLGPFALGGIGAGDVKMMGAVGALLGPRLALLGLLVGMAIGGVIMAAHLARCGRLREKLTATRLMVSTAAGTRSAVPLRISADEPNAVTLPYSVPLGLGAIAALLATAG